MSELNCLNASNETCCPFLINCITTCYPAEKWTGKQAAEESEPQNSKADAYHAPCAAKGMCARSPSLEKLSCKTYVCLRRPRLF
jgi:hypothetical protein